MSDNEIRQIIKRLDEQDRMLKDIAKELTELKPMKEAFNSVMGFDRVAVWFLKFLAMLGAGIGVIVLFIKWLKAWT